MGVIALEGVRFYAKHGFYEEERILGNWYVVDVQVMTDLPEADELVHTINYETVYEICRIVMETPTKLLEKLVERIIAGLNRQFPAIKQVAVSVRKENPPLGGQVAYSRVEYSNTKLVALEGMRFYASHGFHEEEQILGTWYMVDVEVATNLAAAAATDDLAKTINYETIYEICRIEMEEPSQLLESITGRIIAGLKHQFQTIQEVTVSIKKENPPLGGQLANACVKDSENYMEKCGRCGRSIICYGDMEDCWCSGITVFPRTQEVIEQEYDGCLCQSCLDFYKN